MKAGLNAKTPKVAGKFEMVWVSLSRPLFRGVAVTPRIFQKFAIMLNICCLSNSGERQARMPVQHKLEENSSE